MAVLKFGEIERYPVEDPAEAQFGVAKRLKSGDYIHAEVHTHGFPAEGSYSIIVPTELGGMAALNYFKSLEEIKTVPPDFRSWSNVYVDTEDVYDDEGSEEGMFTTQAVEEISKLTDARLGFFRLDTPRVDVTWSPPHEKFTYSTRKIAEVGLIVDDLSRARVQQILGDVATPPVAEILNTTLNEFAEYFPQLRQE